MPVAESRWPSLSGSCLAPAFPEFAECSRIHTTLTVRLPVEHASPVISASTNRAWTDLSEPPSRVDSSNASSWACLGSAAPFVQPTLPTHLSSRLDPSFPAAWLLGELELDLDGHLPLGPHVYAEFACVRVGVGTLVTRLLDGDEQVTSPATSLVAERNMEPFSPGHCLWESVPLWSKPYHKAP